MNDTIDQSGAVESTKIIRLDEAQLREHLDKRIVGCVEDTPNKRLPAEWEPQSCIWLSWPVAEHLWAGQLDAATDRLAQFASVLSRFQTVRINCGVAHHPQIETKLKSADAELANIILHDHPTNDAWCRDHGGITVFDEHNKPFLSNWEFNAWGGKYPPWDLDNQVPLRMAEALGLECVSVATILEGGAIDSNGAGQLLTTEAVLLNKNRYDSPSCQRMETLLGEYFGISQVLWLGDGLHNDDTDGHIDNLARFVAKDAIAYAITSNPKHPDYAVLQENKERLEGFRTSSGGHFDLIPLPMPEPVRAGGEMLAASYANFVIVNGGVIVPSFEQKADTQAQGILKECFRNREVIGLSCTDFLLEGGAVHCLSMNGF